MRGGTCPSAHLRWPSHCLCHPVPSRLSPPSPKFTLTQSPLLCCPKQGGPRLNEGFTRCTHASVQGTSPKDGELGFQFYRAAGPHLLSLIPVGQGFCGFWSHLSSTGAAFSSRSWPAQGVILTKMGPSSLHTGSHHRTLSTPKCFSTC